MSNRWVAACRQKKIFCTNRQTIPVSYSHTLANVLSTGNIFLNTKILKVCTHKHLRLRHKLALEKKTLKPNHNHQCKYQKKVLHNINFRSSSMLATCKMRPAGSTTHKSIALFGFVAYWSINRKTSTWQHSTCLEVLQSSKSPPFTLLLFFSVTVYD